MKTALILDDSDFDLKILCLYLEKLGIEAICCKSMTSCAHQLKYGRAQINVMFLDLVLGDDVNGMTFLRTMNPKKFPIIVMSGLGDMSTIVKCLKEGASSYIIKPCSDEALRRVLNSINII